MRRDRYEMGKGVGRGRGSSCGGTGMKWERV